MNKTLVATSALVLPLAITGTVAVSSCSELQADKNQVLIDTASVSAKTALAIAQQAIDAWPITKGILQVAALDPKLTVPITAGIAANDLIIAKLRVLVASGSADAPALVALAHDVNQQAQALTIQSAAAVKVVPATGA